MKKEYDFSDSVKNPYAKLLKKQVTLRLNVDAITYFKQMATETGVPYQNLINLYLTECAYSCKKLKLKWESPMVGEQDKYTVQRSAVRDL